TLGETDQRPIRSSTGPVCGGRAAVPAYYRAGNRLAPNEKDAHLPRTPGCNSPRRLREIAATSHADGNRGIRGAPAHRGLAIPFRSRRVERRSSRADSLEQIGASGPRATGADEISRIGRSPLVWPLLLAGR